MRSCPKIARVYIINIYNTIQNLTKNKLVKVGSSIPVEKIMKFYSKLKKEKEDTQKFLNRNE